MTQDEKDLLLKDLCARLPYGTMVYAQNAVYWYDSEICTQVLSDVINEDYIVKPYLFPLESMTKEQRKEYDKIIYKSIELHHREYSDIVEIDLFDDLQEFYHKNHFDYRGLIDIGLAIDCTNLNIY